MRIVTQIKNNVNKIGSVCIQINTKYNLACMYIKMFNVQLKQLQWVSDKANYK